MTTDAHAGFDPAAVLEQIDAATEHLLHTAARFTDADVRAPSLLPDWSRGHVLTHLAATPTVAVDCSPGPGPEYRRWSIRA